MVILFLGWPEKIEDDLSSFGSLKWHLSRGEKSSKNSEKEITIDIRRVEKVKKVTMQIDQTIIRIIIGKQVAGKINFLFDMYKVSWLLFACMQKP